MTTTATETTAQGEVRALLDAWCKAASAKDLDAVMACYAPEVRAFDAIGQLQFKGAEAYRAHWQFCLSFMPGPMRFEVHELEVASEGDLAFCHYLASCGGTDADGVEHSGWTRATVCLRRADGRWRIVHEHYSAPFDPESMKALCDLGP